MIRKTFRNLNFTVYGYAITARQLAKKQNDLLAQMLLPFAFPCFRAATSDREQLHKPSEALVETDMFLRQRCTVSPLFRKP